jgi:hypothetical protein
VRHLLGNVGSIVKLRHVSDVKPQNLLIMLWKCWTLSLDAFIVDRNVMNAHL